MARLPPIPYRKGQRFTIREHHPPPHSPSLRLNIGLTSAAIRERDEITPLQRCLLHPPVGGTLGSGVVELEVQEPIKVNEHKLTQLVCVRIISSSTKSLQAVETVVAKFYDPLYHQDEDTDPFLCADHSFITESATYNRLQDLQGKRIPKFYGSYCVEIPAGNGGKSRSVRLILIQRINGDSMSKLDPQKFSQTERQKLLKGIIDAETESFERDVWHDDLREPNILVVSKLGKIHQVILIDFESNFLTRKRDPRDPRTEEQFLPRTYVSPLLRWREELRYHYDFRMWIDWDYQKWLEITYAHDTISDEVRKRYGPKAW